MNVRTMYGSLAASVLIFALLAVSGFAAAAGVPFGSSGADTGYLLAATGEGEGEEGSCGEAEEGSCGEAEEGSCGEAEEGSCGEAEEGSCGEAEGEEGRCGEGKCGEGEGAQG